MPADENWDTIFDVLLSKVKGGAREFIESVYQFYEKNGYLSQKQEAAILKFWERTSAKDKGLK